MTQEANLSKFKSEVQSSQVMFSGNDELSTFSISVFHLLLTQILWTSIRVISNHETENVVVHSYIVVYVILDYCKRGLLHSKWLFCNLFM